MNRHNLRRYLLAATLMITGILSAQNRKDDIPMDQAIRYGKLDNGLTYYVRENAIPEDRAEFYLVVNAGAILENPDQNGLAHFCEHMAFNGTKNFEKHEIIEWLQSIGMKFGPEINAYTTHDNTTYILQKVPVDIPENIDTALLILHDWAGHVSFEGEEIDNERGVIHEEWRVRRGADFRLMNQYQKVVFKDSKYAEHDVIGDVDIIMNHEYKTIRDFYNDWYRPNLEAIIVVGDIDPAEIEAKIIAQFNDLKNPENERPREEFTVPEHQETYVSILTDKEATKTMSMIFWKHDPPAKKDLTYYRESILQNLYSMMINQRLSEKLTQKDPPYAYAFSAYMPYIRTVDTYLAGAIANNGEALKALEAVLIENQRVKEFGFTQSELERNKEQLRTMIEKMYNERAKKESRDYVQEYQSHFLEGDPIPGIEYDYAYINEILPEITVEEINSLAKKYIRPENRVVVITGPEDENIEMPQEEEVLNLLEKVQNMTLTPYEDVVVNTPLVSNPPEKGKRAKRSKNKAQGTETWVLKNGVTITFKPTKFKDDEILMSAWSHGGISSVKTKHLPSANMAVDIIEESGLGKHDKNALQKLLIGTFAEVHPILSQNWEGFKGSCRSTDFETMLQLTYLYFTEPRLDNDAVEGLISRKKAMLENRLANPQTILFDSLSMIMAQYHPRVEPFTVAYLDRVEPERAYKIFQRRFGDPSGFHFYFVGNIDPDEARPLIEKWLGGLPNVQRDEKVTDHQIRPPKTDLHKQFTKAMETPQGTVAIVMPGEFDYDNEKERLLMTAVKDILDVRYTETIRETEGGSYGVSVQFYPRKEPWENYRFLIYFNGDPERTLDLKEIVYREIENLIKNGPEAKNVKGFKENMLKTRSEKMKENEYWLKMLSKNDRLDLPYTDTKAFETLINSITAEEIRKTAEKYLNTNKIEFILLPE